MARFEIPGTGWHPDVPDSRDYSPKTPQIKRLLAPLSVDDKSSRPSKVDLREYFPEVDHQQRVNCSCAHACIALVEYFQRLCFGHTTRLSHLFLYNTTRRVLGVTGNVSTDIRSTLNAMRSCGIPPERYWPYEETTIDDEPDAFLYSFDEPYKSITYVRLDATDKRGKKTLKTVKAFLAAGIPVAFGFSVPNSISHSGDIPYRPRFDGVYGGQAVVAVGYDDERLRESRGALLIRNSWGGSWGEDGYGWLPYAYVTSLLATDCWTILKSEWLESGGFSSPTS